MAGDVREFSRLECKLKLHEDGKMVLIHDHQALIFKTSNHLIKSIMQNFHMLQMTRLALFSVALLCHSQSVPANETERPPNIVFIFVDDQGYYDLGCYGASEVQTPRIDAIAEQGTRLTDYYAAAPICSPSRAGLLTGCYPRRVGNHIWVHRADSPSGIHPNELTIAELLKDKGYATACIGKWHLGFYEPFLPGNQGFDHYFGLLHNLDPVEVVYFEDKGSTLR